MQMQTQGVVSFTLFVEFDGNAKSILRCDMLTLQTIKTDVALPPPHDILQKIQRRVPQIFPTWKVTINRRDLRRIHRSKRFHWDQRTLFTRHVNINASTINCSLVRGIEQAEPFKSLDACHGHMIPIEWGVEHRRWLASGRKLRKHESEMQTATGRPCVTTGYLHGHQ